MVFSIKVMPPGAAASIVPSTPIDEDHEQVQPDFHYAVEASDDDTFADIRNRALKYIEEDDAEYLQKYPAETFGELKLEKGTTLRPKQKVGSIFPGHTSAEEIVLLLHHKNEQASLAKKRKAPEQPLPTPDTFKRSKGKERATEPQAGPSSSNAMDRIMSSQRSQQSVNHRATQHVNGDPKQAPHWSLEEDRAFLPHILNGKLIKEALELAGLSDTRSEAAGRNRRKFYVDKNVTMDNLERVRLQSARGRKYALVEGVPDSTQFPQRSTEPATKPKPKKSNLPKKSKSLGSRTMPPPPSRVPRMTAPPSGAKEHPPQSTDDALLELLDDISDGEPEVVRNSMASQASDEPAEALALITHGQGDGASSENDVEQDVETHQGDQGNDTAHHEEEEDDSEVIEFEDISGSVDEEVHRDELDLSGERLVEVWPSDDESGSEFDPEEYDPRPRRFMRVSGRAYERIREAAIANRQAYENGYDSVQDVTVKPTQVDETAEPGLPDLPLPTMEPEPTVDDQPQQITRPPRQHASHLTDEALEAQARKKCVHYSRDGSWYLDFLIYQRELQYALDDGDEDAARTLRSDFDHLDMQYRLKLFKRGPELFDGHGDFDPTPLIMRPGDDVPEMIYSDSELKRQKQAFDRREEELREMREAAELRDGEEVESENEEYYTVPTSAQKPREESHDEHSHIPLRQPKLLNAKLSKVERKALNRAAKRAAKVRNARA